MPRGGLRKGAGRPTGTGKFGVSTKAMRVPENMIDDVLDLIGGQGFDVPLYASTVSAGQTFAADDRVEENINLHKYLMPQPKNNFLVRVTGESMLNAGIHHDDMLVVERASAARDGDIVIARLNAEITVKRFHKNTHGEVVLLPENDEFEPIVIHESDELSIYGVVRNVIHDL